MNTIMWLEDTKTQDIIGGGTIHVSGGGSISVPVGNLKVTIHDYQSASIILSKWKSPKITTNQGTSVKIEKIHH